MRRKSLKQLYRRYPRQVGTKRRTVQNTSELQKWLDTYTGIKNCYVSLYHLENRSFRNTEVDKVYFDFDEDDAVEDARRLSDYLFEKGLKHTVVFSGNKGFNVYLFTKGYEHVNLTKDCLINVHRHFQDELGISNDEQIIGDIARISRVPNTLHLKSQKWCRPITRKELHNKTFEEIKEDADTPREGIIVYGEKRLGLNQFDKKTKRKYKAQTKEIPSFKSQFKEPDEEVMKHIHPSIRSWLLKPEKWCKNKTRYLFAKYCSVKGIPPDLCDTIAKKYWNDTLETGGRRTKYREFVDERQIQQAYGTDNQFPYLKTLIDKGLVPGRIEDYEPLGLYYEG